MNISREKFLQILDEAVEHASNKEIGLTRRELLLNTIDLWENEGYIKFEETK